MCKKLAFLFVVLTLSPLIFAQHNQRQSSAGGAQLAGSDCAFTFTTGKNHGLTQYCVSTNGNIVQFSSVFAGGGSQEFLDNPTPATEGYGFCGQDTRTAYWDYASDASTNWNPATSVATTTSVTTTRTTADGIWQLVQTITLVKGSPTKFGGAQISMAVTNLSTTDRLLQINRHAHVQGFGANEYFPTQNSVFGALPTLSGNGLLSTASFVTTQFDANFAEVMTVPTGPNPCVPFSSQGGQFAPFQGDGSIEQIFGLDILPGKTKTVKLTYRPF